jgi:uncharacterized protein YebE (UPF0316 family)
MIEEKIALGMQIIRIITKADFNSLISEFKKIHQGYTIVEGEGAQGPVKLIFLQVRRKNKTEVIELIHTHLPESFYSIEDIRNSHMGFFSKSKRR